MAHRTGTQAHKHRREICPSVNLKSVTIQFILEFPTFDCGYALHDNEQDHLPVRLWELVHHNLEILKICAHHVQGEA